MTIEFLKRGNAAVRELVAESGNHDRGQVEAVAAAVSIIAPLFLPIMVLQHQIVSGLSAGAVKA
jgi:ABC-type glycerol-3-phosphate transport system permease component